ncbi:MAG: peptide chain release factor-like protein, partial [Thermoguttaceae bacterium]|nr:peptide chain release factor-like protein [Thermoguttaceae bacterium]
MSEPRSKESSSDSPAGKRPTNGRSPAQTLDVPGVASIPLSEIEITYARSSGPGGQNVNKVSSKARLR